MKTVIVRRRRAARPAGSFRTALVFLWNLIRYAVSDLRFRRAATGLCVAAVALAAVYLDVLGFYGTRFYRARGRQLDESLETRIIAAAPDVANVEQLFTGERVEQVGRLPGVKLAFPHVELQVSFGIDGKTVDLPAEGTVAHAPMFVHGRLAWGRAPADDAREAVVSRALFEKLGGAIEDGMEPPTATLRVGRTAGGRDESRQLELRVVGLLQHQQEERVYLPLPLLTALDLWCTSKIENVPGEGVGVAAPGPTYPYCHAWSPLDQAGRVAEEARALKVKAERVGEVEVCDAGGAVWVVVGRRDGLPLRQQDRAALGRVLAGNATAAAGQLSRVLQLALWDVRAPEELPEEPHLIQGRDLGAIRQRLAAAGLAGRLLSPARTERLVKYRIHDPHGPRARVREDLITVLAMTRPTFVAAHGAVSVAGRFSDAAADAELVGSDSSDPLQFGSVLQAGTWLRAEGGSHQVVLPRAIAEELGGAEVVGRGVEVTFRRGRDEGLTVRLRVVGVTDGGPAYVPLRFAAGVERWRQRKVVYNEAKRVFEEPAALALRDGALRCTVYATDAEAVRGVVRRLQDLGYRTEDRLAEQEGLQRLGRMLVFVVIFFALGCVLNAAITVLITTMMNVRSKTWEIGILRAHGLGARGVVTIFLVQGLLIGVVSFAVAAGAVWLLEPLLRTGVCQALSLEAGAVLTGSPFDADLWWLWAAVLGVCVGFSLLGVAIPAALAARLSPVEALRRRE